MHAGAQGAGVPFGNGGDQVGGPSQSECSRKASNDGDDPPLQPQRLQGVINRPVLLIFPEKCTVSLMLQSDSSLTDGSRTILTTVTAYTAPAVLKAPLSKNATTTIALIFTLHLPAEPARHPALRRARAEPLAWPPSSRPPGTA